MSDSESKIKQIDNALADAGFTFQSEFDGYSDSGYWKDCAKHLCTFANGAAMTTFDVPFNMGASWGSDSPFAADVLYSMLSDASLAADSFAEFCANTGYNEDSRKAYATWEGMRDAADKFRAFFPEDLREQFAEILQDY